MARAVGPLRPYRLPRPDGLIDSRRSLPTPVLSVVTWEFLASAMCITRRSFAGIGSRVNGLPVLRTRFASLSASVSRYLYLRCRYPSTSMFTGVHSVSRLLTMKFTMNCNDESVVPPRPISNPESSP